MGILNILTWGIVGFLIGSLLSTIIFTIGEYLVSAIQPNTESVGPSLV